MIAHLSRNELTGNSQITVDEADLDALRRALWHQQCHLIAVMRQYPDHRERLWREIEERWIPQARALGADVVAVKYEDIIRKGIETT